MTVINTLKGFVLFLLPYLIDLKILYTEHDHVKYDPLLLIELPNSI